MKLSINCYIYVFPNLPQLRNRTGGNCYSASNFSFTPTILSDNNCQLLVLVTKGCIKYVVVIQLQIVRQWLLLVIYEACAVCGAGVANISERIRQARLRWLGHVERKTEEDVVMRTWKWVDTERQVRLTMVRPCGEKD